MNECTGCHKVNYCSTFCQRKVIRSVCPPNASGQAELLYQGVGGWGVAVAEYGHRLGFPGLVCKPELARFCNPICELV